MEDIQIFHQYLFNGLLHLGRDGVEFALEKSQVPLLMVPLKKTRWF